jgi:hypothetical protein
MKRRVYVAGAFAEMRRAKTAMRIVQELGYHLNLDWTASIDAVAGVADRDLPAEAARRYADGDINGVLGCDVFWFLVPPDGKGRGAWVELGAAIASPRCQIIASGDAKSSIFLTLVDKLFATDEEAAAWLKETKRDG